MKRTVVRAFPLLAAAPVFVYQVYLFSFHPVFSASSTQGAQPHVPLFWHMLSLGITLFLIPWRLYVAPIRSPAELLLLIWAIVLFVLFHANGISTALSFSPQVAMSIMSPIILLAVTALPRIRLRENIARRSIALNASVVVLGCLTTPFYVARALDDVHGKEEILYLSENDHLAIDWLQERTTPNALILSSYRQCNKLSAQLNRRFILGHWGFSPNNPMLTKICDGILSAKYEPSTARSLLEEYQVDFIYVPAECKTKAAPYLEGMPEIKLVFRAADVHIFSVERIQRK